MLAASWGVIWLGVRSIGSFASATAINTHNTTAHITMLLMMKTSSHCYIIVLIQLTCRIRLVLGKTAPKNPPNPLNSLFLENSTAFDEGLADESDEFFAS